MKNVYLGVHPVLSAGYPSDTDSCPTITDMDSLKNRLHEVLNFVGNQGEGIERVLAKLTGGCEASNPKVNGVRPEPAGDIGSMNTTLDDIMSRLHRTGDAVLRLNRAI